ncbi:velvet factor-domain-containing protein [Fennellomyces sp. T-0311]|nr:velvet factor-domain-containing protein [Fennellomyces sp. T-0311]
MSHFDSSQPLILTAPTTTRLPKSFDLIIRQQPVHSRMCGVGERVDRRPIDPPPIVQLKLIGQSNDEILQSISPYIFLVAVLVPADIQDDGHLQLDFHSRLTIGRTVSSLYLLRDLDNTEGAFFVFSDISVRADGHYRLRVCLFEIVESGVHYRRGLLTDPFTVYSAKKFPGMHLSCPLARHFAQQGLKIRIRKESRKRSTGSRRYSRQDEDDDMEDSSSESRPGLTTRESDESYSSVNDSPAVEESRPILVDLGAHCSTASNSSNNSSITYRRVSNDSSTGKMLRLVASDSTPGTSADPKVYERPRIQQGIGTSSRVRLVDLLHPNLPDNPTFDDNGQLMSSITPVSSHTSITGEGSQYQLMDTRRASRTEVAAQAASEFNWRLPPIAYDDPTYSSSSTSTPLYEQSQRNELLRHPYQYETPTSLASSSNPSTLSHNHPMYSSSNPNTVITGDARPDRPEIILYGESTLTNRPPREHLVLPSLREHFGELAVPPHEDKSNSKTPEQPIGRQ